MLLKQGAFDSPNRTLFMLPSRVEKPLAPQPPTKTRNNDPSIERQKDIVNN